MTTPSPATARDDDGAPPRDPIRKFTDLAAARGLIRPGDKLDQNMIEFAQDVVELAAIIGERYGDSENGGNAGEHIRAELGADPSSTEEDRRYPPFTDPPPYLARGRSSAGD